MIAPPAPVPSAEDKRSPLPPADVRQLVVRARVLLPGLYAWIASVATPAAARSAPGASRVLALGALACLVAGPLVAINRPRVGRIVGVWGFLGLCLAAWLVLGPLIGVQRLDPVRAALGGVGWALFAFGWGAVRRRDDVPENDPNAIEGDQLAARGGLPRGASVVLGLGVGASLVPVFLAWRVSRPEHALLAHAAALVCAIGIVNGAALVAVERGKWRPLGRPRARLAAAGRSLGLVSLLLCLGLLALVFR